MLTILEILTVLEELVVEFYNLLNRLPAKAKAPQTFMDFDSFTTARLLYVIKILRL